jgi:hypothetical protein
MAAQDLDVVKLMAKHTAALLEGLVRIVACKRARSSLMKLRRTVISDVDQLYPCTLSVVEKVMIRGLATSESGGCD